MATTGSRHLLLLFLAFVLASRCFSQCPPGCTCNTASREIRCKGLQDLPSSIPGGTLRFYCIDCLLWELTSAKLSAMRQLEQLILKSAGLYNIAAYAFDDFQNLEFLDLSNNHLQIIDGTSFVGCPKLKSLILTSNQIQDINGPFIGIDGLETLDFRYNSFQVIPGGNAFINLRGVTWLRFENNRLEEIHPFVFSGLTSLYYLGLYNNKIHTIHPGAFKDLGSLSKLYLGRNRISDFDPDLFKPLTSLKMVDLNTNQLRMKPGMFQYLSNVEEMRLYLNNIPELAKRGFFGMAKLATLDLHSNKVKQLDNGLFDGLVSLEMLDLSDNKISKVTPLSLQPMKRLNWFSLRKNELGMKDGAVFSELQSLQTFSLAFNKFYDVPKHMDLPNLSQFDISNNRISVLPDSLGLLKSPKLVTAVLGGNLLTEIKASHFQSFRELKRLYVSMNKIPTFRAQDLQPVFSNLDMLSIYGNPIHCNCEVAWLKAIPKQSYFRRGSALYCRTPHTKSLLYETSDVDFSCVKPDIISSKTGVRVVNDTLQLRCAASGDPIPDVSWEYVSDMQGGQLPILYNRKKASLDQYGRTSENTNNLDVSVKSIPAYYKGFICRAESSVGKDTNVFVQT